MKYKMGDIVERVHGNVDRFTTDLKYYVAGEQFESRELLITRKGLLTPETVNLLGFKFHFPFKSGDVLFMARSPHLRKAGMVTFDGICSDASYILRSKDESILLQRFLPFIVQSDLMWDYFNAHKTGSVNPLLNWKEFCRFEIELPTIEEQERFATLLWAIERARTSYKNLLTQMDELVKSQFVEMFGTPDTNVHGYPIGTIGEVSSDVHYGTSKKAEDTGRYTYIRMNNITYSGELDLTDIKFIDIPEKELEGCIVRKGDVLFNRTNSKELVGKTCAFMLDSPMVIAGYIIRLRMNGRVTANYLSTFMNLPSSKKMLMAMAKGAVGQANINAQEVQAISIVIPPMPLQQEFETLLCETDKSKLAIQQALDSLEKSRNAIMKKVFG